MSKENLEQFATQIADSEELRASIENQLYSDGNISADTLIALGTEHGFEFTVEDLAENAELSDEELDGVAGGLSGWHIEMFTGKAVKGDVKFRIGPAKYTEVEWTY